MLYEVITVIDEVKVRGMFKASEEVKAALADRIK